MKSKEQPSALNSRMRGVRVRPGTQGSIVPTLPYISARSYFRGSNPWPPNHIEKKDCLSLSLLNGQVKMKLYFIVDK